jgi:glycosyltransferase domain-containing protein
MNKKQNLTILIPVYNSNNYLDRALSYLNLKKCNFRIFISDGSKIKSDQKSIKKKYENLDIFYNYFGYDYHYSKFLKKMYKSLNKIDTKYVYWLCDDDFVSLNVLNFGLNKLNKSGLIFFGGRVKNFSIVDASNVWSEIKMEDYQYKKLSSKDINSFQSINLISRLKNLGKFQPYEGIISRKVLLTVFYYANKLKIKNAHDFALLFKTIPLISGKIYYSNKIILFRQVNVLESQGSKLASDYKSNIKKYFEANLYNFSNNLIKIIQKKNYLKNK